MSRESNQRADLVELEDRVKSKGYQSDPSFSNEPPPAEEESNIIEDIIDETIDPLL